VNLYVGIGGILEKKFQEKVQVGIMCYWGGKTGKVKMNSKGEKAEKRVRKRGGSKRMKWGAKRARGRGGKRGGGGCKRGLGKGRAWYTHYGPRNTIETKE